MRTETCGCGAKTTIHIDKPGESILHSAVTDQEAEAKAIQDWRDNHKHIPVPAKPSDYRVEQF